MSVIAAVNNLASNPGVAVLLGVIVSTFGTALSGFITSRLEERRMEREDRRLREPWEREQENSRREKEQRDREKNLSLYKGFVNATDISPPASGAEMGTLKRLYYEVSMVSAPSIRDAAMKLYRAAEDAVDIDSTARPDSLKLRVMEQERDVSLTAVRDELGK